MKLIYESTGVPVEIGDQLTLDGEEWTVVGIEKPEPPLGNGRVNCRTGKMSYDSSWFPSVIGAIWELEDGKRTGIVES